MIDIGSICQNCFRQTDTKAARCEHCGEPPLAVPGRSERCLPHQTILKGRYLVGRVLGEGGFGITYLALDLATQERVAIKEYFPVELAIRSNTDVPGCTVSIGQGEAGRHFENGLRRFRREAEILKSLNHLQGIVSVRDFFSENNTAYIVMTYIEGETLGSYLHTYMEKQGCPLPYDEAFTMMRPVMHALEEVHKSGIIHRDISPANLLLDRDGELTLIDFGSARAEQAVPGNRSMTVLVKHGYAPEEQYRTRGPQGAWTDIYALCATLYYIISGVVPADAVERLIEDSVVPLDRLSPDRNVPAAYAGIIEKGMNIHAADRYQSIGELLQDLDKAEAEKALKVIEPVTELKEVEAEDVLKEAVPEAALDAALKEVETEAALKEAEPDEKAVEDEPLAAKTLAALSFIGQKQWPKVLLAAMLLIVFLFPFLFNNGPSSSGGEEMSSTAEEAIAFASTDETAEEYSSAESAEQIEDAAFTAGSSETAADSFSGAAATAEETENSTEGTITYSEAEKAAYYDQGCGILYNLLEMYGMGRSSLFADDVDADSTESERISSLIDSLRSIYSLTVMDLYNSGGSEDIMSEYWDARSAIMNAAICFGKAGDYQDGENPSGREVSRMLWKNFGKVDAVSAADGDLAAIHEDGTVSVLTTSGYNEYWNQAITGWSDIIALQDTQSMNEWLALRQDGTLFSTDLYDWNPAAWTDLVESTYVWERGTAGLRSDGKVVVSAFDENGKLMVIDNPDWYDITHISGGEECLVASRADGVILIAEFNWKEREDFVNPHVWTNDGSDAYYEFMEASEVLQKKNLTIGAVNDFYTVEDYMGHAVRKITRQAGDNSFIVLEESGQPHILNFGEESDWPQNRKTRETIEVMDDIVDVEVANWTALFLHEDGRTEMLTNAQGGKPLFKSVASAENVVDICIDNSVAAAVTEDGHLLLGGDNIAGWLDCESWTNIKDITIGTSYDTFGIRDNGTVVSASSYQDVEMDVSSWKDIRAIHEDLRIGLGADGTIYLAGFNTEDFKAQMKKWSTENLVDITETGTLAGLRRDGTVYLGEKNEYNNSLADRSCEEWSQIVDIVATYERIMGLRDDGTVVITGTDDGKISVEEEAILKLSNIIKIDSTYTAGFLVLTEDGHVHSTDSRVEACVGSLTGITDIEFIDYNHFFVKNENGWIMPGDNGEDRSEEAGIPSEFMGSNVVSIQLSGDSVIALFDDGTVKRKTPLMTGREAVERWEDLWYLSRPCIK